MPSVKVMSVFDAFEYVMDHYYPYGCEEMVQQDRYAVISIQDSHTHGFGIQFAKSISCVDVLTLYFDDVEKEVPSAVRFDTEMANQIIQFIKKNINVDTLLVHCYAGQSRSRAVGAFALKMIGKDNSKYVNRTLNRHVYQTLLDAWNGDKIE